jgi:glycine cleavage system transcriptional repressor
MGTFALTTLGIDRPGVTAAIADVLAKFDVNITDSEMSILRGHFVMMLIITVPDDVETESLRSDLEQAGDAIGLEYVMLNEIPDAAGDLSPTPTFSISVYGVDHPGILATITRALADSDVNICDLKTRVVGEGSEKPLYVVLMEVAGTPQGEIDSESLERLLAGPAEAAGVDVSISPIDASVL